MNLEDVHLRDTRANQPLATVVGTGVLYFVTDEDIIEQSDGAAWVSYSAPAGVAAITQLTGDVTAGPGSGSQVATIPANTIVTAKIADAQVTEAKLLIADNVTKNVSITAHGFAPKAPNDATKYLDGVGAYSIPAGAGSSDWTTSIVKAALQDVTNSVVFVDCTDFTIAVLANEVWLVELMLLYSADVVTSDLSLKLVVSAGVLSGTSFVLGMGNSDTINQQIMGHASGAATAIMSIGTNAVIGTPRVCYIKGLFQFSANANFKLQFAQSTAAPATSCRVHAGSIMRGKKVI